MSDAEKFQKQFKAAIDGLVEKHNLAIEGLTGQQIAEAVRQAIQCGDFTRLVRTNDGGQTVVYLPFTTAEIQASRISRLEAALEAAGIPDPDDA